MAIMENHGSNPVTSTFLLQLEQKWIVVTGYARKSIRERKTASIRMINCEYYAQRKFTIESFNLVIWYDNTWRLLSVLNVKSRKPNLSIFPSAIFTVCFAHLCQLKYTLSLSLSLSPLSLSVTFNLPLSLSVTLSLPVTLYLPSLSLLLSISPFLSLTLSP